MIPGYVTHLFLQWRNDQQSQTHPWEDKFLTHSKTCPLGDEFLKTSPWEHKFCEYKLTRRLLQCWELMILPLVEVYIGTHTKKRKSKKKCLSITINLTIGGKICNATIKLSPQLKFQQKRPKTHWVKMFLHDFLMNW